MTRDPYDPAVAFDDLTDDETVMLGGVSLRDRVSHWIDRAKRRFRTHVRGEDVRIDDELSYLTYRVARLEQALKQHMADGHGSPVTILGEALPLPCCEAGAIDCWHDGREIHCTVRFIGPDGIRAATASIPADAVADDVVNAAADAGMNYDEVTVLGGPLTAMIGADSLVSQICGHVGAYLDNPKLSKMRDHSVAANPYLFGCDVILACHGGA